MSVPKKVRFVDAFGGGLAAMAASIAAARGFEASAATSADRVSVGDEIGAVLAEVGLAPAPVTRVADLPSNGAFVMQLGGADGVDVRLYAGPATTDFGDASLERLALARIARDRLERYFGSDN